MTPRVLTAVLAVTAVAVPSVIQAKSLIPITPLGIARMHLADDVIIPPEWAGIWSGTDSTYDCGDPIAKNAQAFTDTFCTGETYEADEGLMLTCTGTVTADEANITCTGSTTLFEGCTANFDATIHATRSGESYSSTTTLLISYSPPLCAFTPDMCTIVNSHATRIAGPPEDCSTPVQPSTWGTIKALYR